MPRVFISYRRDDSADVTGRIYDRLVAELGRQNVFIDVDAIPLGVDFRKHLQSEVSRCDVLLAVIGPDWLELRDGEGNRRIDDDADFVRIEIEAALQRDIPIIPLLVGGASMPRKGQLPPSLRDLAFRNGTPIRPDPDFHHDVDRLIGALRKLELKAPVPERTNSIGIKRSFPKEVLKAEPWRKLPEPWRGVFESYSQMRLAKERIYMAIFPNFGQELHAAGGRDSEHGKEVFQKADRAWHGLTGLPVLCNSMAWQAAAVAAGYEASESGRLSLEEAARAIMAWATALAANRRRANDLETEAKE